MTANNDTALHATRVSLLSRLRDAADHAGWQRFFDTYWRLFYSVARRAGLDEQDAQDVVQETIIAVARQMPEFRYDPARGSFKSWLLLIVNRRVTDCFRRKEARGTGRDRRVTALDTALAETQPAPDAEFARAWDEEWHRHRLDAALAIVKQQVTPQQFQIFQLHVLKEQPVETVKARLGVSAAQVYWAKYRIGRRLEKELRNIEGRDA